MEEYDGHPLVVTLPGFGGDPSSLWARTSQMDPRLPMLGMTEGVEEKT